MEFKRQNIIKATYSKEDIEAISTTLSALGEICRLIPAVDCDNCPMNTICPNDWQPLREFLALT